MFYQLYEMNHAAVQPFRAYADAVKLLYSNPLNPLTHTAFGRSVAAGAELFERTTRRYGKPKFGIDKTVVDWKPAAVHENIVWSRPFCNLIRFVKETPARKRPEPKLLIVAPMSGHYATLLRGTVEAMLPHADVHITDWVDARMVPVTDGRFDLDDYIDYVIDMLHAMGPDTHVMAVCQPSVPVLAAAALMEARRDPLAPSTMTLMGGPIDTRKSPTAVNLLAEAKGIDWFRDNVIMQAPWPVPGFTREVYPGFLQLSGFMGMNLDRHISAHKEFFVHLVKNDGDSAEKHRDFYDEYLAVMDLTAEFYLQTVETVFIRHALPDGVMTHRGTPVEPAAIRSVALMTVEGENDDISGLGQTRAAHDLCVNISSDMRAHYMQPAVGHYGVFNGSRFRSEIVPRIVDFITSYGREGRVPARPRLVRPAKA
jgi:poly(3-hydroxybutyrate) depolymerase